MLINPHQNNVADDYHGDSKLQIENVRDSSLQDYDQTVSITFNQQPIRIYLITFGMYICDSVILETMTKIKFI